MFRSLLNSSIAYKASNSMNGTDFFIYIREVSRELLLEHNLGAAVLDTINTPDTHMSVSLERVLSSTHQFVVFEGKKRKRCKMCYPKRKDMRYCFPGCNGHLGLCSMEH